MASSRDPRCLLSFGLSSKNQKFCKLYPNKLCVAANIHSMFCRLFLFLKILDKTNGQVGSASTIATLHKSPDNDKKAKKCIFLSWCLTLFSGCSFNSQKKNSCLNQTPSILVLRQKLAYLTGPQVMRNEQYF